MTAEISRKRRMIPPCTGVTPCPWAWLTCTGVLLMPARTRADTARPNRYTPSYLSLCSLWCASLANASWLLVPFARTRGRFVNWSSFKSMIKYEEVWEIGNNLLDYELVLRTPHTIMVDYVLIWSSLTCTKCLSCPFQYFLSAELVLNNQTVNTSSSSRR